MENLSKEKIGNIIGNLIETEICVEDYESSLQNTFGVDSIILVELIIELENAFDIEFNDMDLIIGNFESVNAIYNNIKKYLLKY